MEEYWRFLVLGLMVGVLSAVTAFKLISLNIIKNKKHREELQRCRKQRAEFERKMKM